MEPKRYKVFVDCEEDYISGRKQYSIKTIEGLPDNLISPSEEDPTDTFCIARKVLRLLFGTAHNGNELRWHTDSRHVPFRKICEGEIKRTFYSALGIYTVHLCPVRQPTTGYIAGIDSKEITKTENRAMVGKGFPVNSFTSSGFKAAIKAHMKKHMPHQSIHITGFVDHASDDKFFAAISLRVGDNSSATLMAIFTSQIYIEPEDA